jgi:DNA mismatch repair protein MutL
MNLLIDQLFACQMPNLALNGKPVISTFTMNELAERFEK